MPFQPRVPPVAGLCTPVRVDSGPGAPSRVAVRAACWRRVAKAWYVSASAPVVVEQRVHEQAARVGPTGAVTGWGALRMAGGGYFDGTDAAGRTRRVPVLPGASGVRSDAGLWALREALTDDEVVIRQGTRCVSAERAVAHEVCHTSDLREAVVIIDMACAAELTSLRRLRAWLADRPHLRHRSRLQRALRYADEDSRSPMEVRMRLVWELDARRGRPLCNRQVLDLEGRVLAVADLVDPVHGVFGEYDGAEHRTRARHRSDVRREARLRAVGLEGVTAVAGDVEERTELVGRIDGAYARAGTGPRRFEVGDPVDPATGRPRLCLDDRLDLRERDQLLEHRQPVE